MTRDRFNKLVADVLDSLPSEFRSRIRNLAVLVEDRPKRPRWLNPPGPRRNVCSHRLILGTFEGVSSTETSIFDLSTGPDRIVLYQKNIEAICSSEAEIRHEEPRQYFMSLGIILE